MPDWRIAMFGSLGAPEVLLILIVFVLIFGTSRLPQLGKGIGDGIRNFKKAIKDEPEQGKNGKKET
jgi:sec-independent protein translocase protein TatA